MFVFTLSVGEGVNQFIEFDFCLQLPYQTQTTMSNLEQTSLPGDWNKSYRFNQEEKPFSLAFRINGDLISKSEATKDIYRGWAFANEMERYMRVKATKLIRQISQATNPKMVRLLFERLSDLHKFQASIVFPRKMAWIDDVMFSADGDVKELFNEDAILQMSGVLKNRMTESRNYQKLYDETISVEGDDGIHEFMTQFRHMFKELICDEPAKMKGVVICLPDEDTDEQHEKGCFVSERCFVEHLASSHLNPENPMKDTIMEKVLAHKMISLFINPLDYNFDCDKMFNSEESIGNYIVKNKITMD